MAKVSATVRMYKLFELGDCFLVTFTAGRKKSRMLIDCGSFRNSKESAERLKEIVKSIGKELGNAPIDVVVGTHQHNDHVSGFVHAGPQFEEIGINEVWLSWLDDPSDAAARRIGKEYKNLVSALVGVQSAIRNKALGVRGARSREVLDDVLGFYEAKGAAGPPVLPADAVKFLESVSGKPKYLSPGAILNMPGLPAGAVRVYVLGPPRDEDLLFDKDPKKDETYDKHVAAVSLARGLASQFAAAQQLLGAVDGKSQEMLAEEAQFPFDQSVKRPVAAAPSERLKGMRERYQAAPWRTIDEDWLGQAENLALYLDTFTNNSSLVLAIELVDSGKVLLFAADAQTGNWLSWPSIEWVDGATFEDLMARTVFYKVGHHASHNATLPKIFEMMTNDRLVALIPVHKQDPNIKKKNGWKMPAANLFKKLKEQTSGRVLQMDGDNPQDCDPKKNPAKASWKKAGIAPKITDLYIELNFS
ncbi:MBL fold metallo-hydrolase [Pseudolabrys sp. FHR47]|uniref:MBL fold metallo-hydrolase n=1 Tax=Pseudolabrys sp. FHR47 TaxID=2562284 RepID=UPI0010BE438C|nr:MBL fold metallo-hydrolase [Pseudolabrys sp. FHR47]